LTRIEIRFGKIFNIKCTHLCVFNILVFQLSMFIQSKIILLHDWALKWCKHNMRKKDNCENIRPVLLYCQISVHKMTKWKLTYLMRGHRFRIGMIFTAFVVSLRTYYLVRITYALYIIIFILDPAYVCIPKYPCKIIYSFPNGLLHLTKK